MQKKKQPRAAAPQQTDRRRLRSEASRERIVRAMLQLVGEGDMPRTVPISFTSYAGMDIGRDNGLVVDRDYEDKAPYKFTGTVKQIYAFDLAHLLENKSIENLPVSNPDSLKVYSSDVLAKIQTGDESLAQMIPPPIFEVIKAKRLFGWGSRAGDVCAAPPPAAIPA